jgi:hypothetical protein
MSHSSKENLTRDWVNTNTIRKMPPCAAGTGIDGDGGCHRLHYDWTFCNQDKATGASVCQSMISAREIYDIVTEAIDGTTSDQFERTQLRAVASG